MDELIFMGTARDMDDGYLGLDKDLIIVDNFVFMLIVIVLFLCVLVIGS